MLLEALDTQVEGAHVGGRRLGIRADGEPEAVHGQGVGQCGGLQVHVQAAVQVRCRVPVDPPPAVPVALEQSLAWAAAGPAGHAGAAGAPVHVDLDGVVDDPGAALFDGGGAAGQQVAVIDGLEKDHLEAGASS